MQISAYSPTFHGKFRNKIKNAFHDSRDKKDISKGDLAAGATAGATTVGGAAVIKAGARVSAKAGAKKTVGYGIQEAGERIAKNPGRISQYASKLIAKGGARKIIGKTLKVTAPIIGGALAVLIVGSQLVSSFKLLDRLVD